MGSRGVFLKLIRMHALPPGCGTAYVARLIATDPTAARLVRNETSPWEVFLRPEHAARISIHYLHRNQQGR